MKVLGITHNNSITGVEYGMIDIADTPVTNAATRQHLIKQYQRVTTKKSAMIKNHMQHKKQK